MKNKYFSDRCFLLVIGFTLTFLFLFALACSGQSYHCFNDRSNQEGMFCIKIESDSISIQESFEYKVDAYHTSIFYNNWEEQITTINNGQMYFEIFTPSAQWIFFYCEDDVESHQVCELYYKPIVGETLHYQKLLK